MGRFSIQNRYTHASLRLKFRYNIDITFDEFSKLCDNFMEASIGKTQDERFSIEGWVKIKGEWVCAKYDQKNKVIMTFMPKPMTIVMEDMVYHFKKNLVTKLNEEIPTKENTGISRELQKKLFAYRTACHSILKLLIEKDYFSALQVCSSVCGKDCTDEKTPA